jgi:hypothetical protein
LLYRYLTVAVKDKYAQQQCKKSGSALRKALHGVKYEGVNYDVQTAVSLIRSFV